MKHHKTGLSGFTLIELMIVVAIIGILASVALPSYLQSVRDSRRTEAMSALTQAAALQERWYFTNNAYGGNIGSLMTGAAAATWTTSDGFYDITLANDAVTCAAGLGTCFLLTATAAGSQVNDIDCSQFTLLSDGTQTALTQANVQNTANCWRN